MNLISQNQIRGLSDVLEQAQNINIGVEPLATGVSSLFISDSFTNAPDGISLTINKPSGGAPNINVYPYDLSTTGFYIDLDTQALETGYNVAYTAFFV